MQKTRVWAHHWVLARTPEQHQHLVNDVDKGDIDDLFVRQGQGQLPRASLNWLREVQKP
jgi:hypothetical protein